MKKQKRKQQQLQHEEARRDIGARFEAWAEARAASIQAALRGVRKLEKAVVEVVLYVLFVIGALAYYWSTITKWLQ